MRGPLQLQLQLQLQLPTPRYIPDSRFNLNGKHFPTDQVAPINIRGVPRSPRADKVRLIYFVINFKRARQLLDSSISPSPGPGPLQIRSDRSRSMWSVRTLANTRLKSTSICNKSKVLSKAYPRNITRRSGHPKGLSCGGGLPRTNEEILAGHVAPHPG